MKKFTEECPHFPFRQVLLAKLKETEKLFIYVASSLPQIKGVEEELENGNI